MKQDKPKKNKKDSKSREIATTVFPLSFIRELNQKEKNAKIVSIVEDEMDFFA